MSDWKILGEVPDSEEEDAFDSQELATDPVPTATSVGETPATNSYDIWEFAGSQDATGAIHRLPSPSGSLSSSPLSSAQSVDGLPELDAMFLDDNEVDSAKEAPDGWESNDNGSRVYIELENRAPTAFEDIPYHGIPSQGFDEDTTLPSQDLGLLENTQILQREAVRLERSLRPRKPIQEHPYRLDFAQYSNLIRQHGMRPVQMAMAHAKAARDETSQDAEFQEDSPGNSLPEANHSSQLNGNSLGESGDPVYDFPSSSPPKTSPWISHGRSSNHGSSQGDTDNTSVPDQELPALHELLAKPRRKTSPSTKRSNDTLASSARKRRRQDIVDSDPVDVHTSGQNTHAPSGRRLAAGPLPPIPRLQPNARRSVDVSPAKTVLTIDNSSSSEGEENEDEEMQEEQGNLSEEPGNGGLDYKRRIRGVLPASWLRLDQKAGRDKAQKHLHGRQRNRAEEKEVRRGLAQTRTISNTPATTDPTLFFDESEDDEAAILPAATDIPYPSQTRIILIPDEMSAQANVDLTDEDSIIEHDTIDTMSGGLTQRRASSDANQHPKARPTSNRGASTKSRQQKITASLVGPKSTTSGRLKPQQLHKQNSDRSGSKRRSASRPAPKPLSVLDVIEPDAPQFLRIAARTAKRRVNQGRSTPSKKIIRLASRVDHVDAVASLNKWKSGSIPQREEVSEARREKRKQAPRRPLVERVGHQPIAARHKPKPTKAATNKSRKFVKQTSSRGSARYLPFGNRPNALTPVNIANIVTNDGVPPPSDRMQHARQGGGAMADSVYASRSAMLEVEEIGKVLPLVFHRRKKFLDRIYYHDNREPSIDAADVRSEAGIGPFSTANPSRIGRGGSIRESTSEKQPKRRARPKKPRKPVRVDVDAPQFNHAADPIPTSYTVEIEPERPQTADAGVKLAGLGPYGTQYTTHFEMFPLDPGVYFHQSTLLGSGVIEDCRKYTKRQMFLSPRPRVTFQFGTHSCRWGDWNAQTSSEVGIVLDLIAEELEKPGGITIPGEATVLEASKFISTFSRAALNFTDESAIKPFVTRVLHVVRGLHTRLSGLVASKLMSHRGSQTTIRVYDNLLILVLVTLMICSEDSELIAEKFEVEDLLRSLAAASMSNLLQMGIGEVQESYTQLRETASREQGIREDQSAIHSWALIMQILEVSHILRGSFWDVLKETVATDDQVSVAEAQAYERIWEVLFTMLPVTEFSSSGILIPGKRHEANSDGWTIVQQLLRRVFTIYRENTRQSPSFNNYCRALIGRCHYLVQQWGWQRSVSIVGTIFDFFGLRNLEHLRNEEVNASPSFLERLAGDPSLAVEPGDRCFHIFLKLLALSIQKLRAAGAIKDIRNLVARTLPNHNRQHLKEQTVHERDLAALRNHHDLLATLYWAAPPALRPSPVLIERLVAAETSHKEASLVNIHCWNQLSRFIVSKGEASTAFKPFHVWRSSFFQKMVQQFDTAATDIQQQLLALPSELRHTVSEDMISSMVSMNKGAVGDVLQASIAASLDVMKNAADMDAAIFCLNTLQLQHIYKQFGIYPPELNWNTLRAAISTLEVFVNYIAEFKENEESQESESQILNSAQVDDAVLLLDRDISKRYFSMMRCILSNGTRNRNPAVSDDFEGVEQGVAVAVRLAAIFIKGGLIKLHDLFERGTYGLFNGSIYKLDFDQRQYLVLVVVTLLKAGIDNFADAEFTLCELWLLVLVKPNRYLKYEKQLADVLRQRGEYFIPSNDTGLTSSPNYECNGTLFEFAISAMRSSIRDAGPSLKRILTTEHSKALKLVMEQMKEDLKATSSQPVTHVPYVAFARRIISLIRTHGSDICTLDNFYYQISKDYSPSVEDPQLQIAAMVSYGLRLREGDTKVVQQVFFFLFNNFKMALISDRLKLEKNMLRKGMGRDRGITHFVLGKMLPAIIEATASRAVAYPLLDLYVWAVASRLRHSATTYSLTDADLPAVKAVIQAILNGVDGWITEQAPLTTVRLHTLQVFFAAANLLWPSLYQYSLNQTVLPGPLSDIMELNKALRQYIIAGRDTLSQAGLRSCQMQFDQIFAAASGDSAPIRLMMNGDVGGFVDNIKQDVDRNWLEVDGRIFIQTPGKPRGGGALQGVLQASWDASTLIAGTISQLTEWLCWKEKMDGGHYVIGGQRPESIMF